MTNRRISLILLVIISALAGALLDFVMSGVFKIVWIVVYGPAYFVAAKVLLTRLHDTRYESFSNQAVIALFTGAILTHVLAMGAVHESLYEMSLVSTDPLTLHSDQWPQQLVVSSDRVSATLAGRAGSTSPQQSLRVLVSRITDYGCTRKSTVASVAEISMLDDADARWTWKLDPQSRSTVESGPGYEDSALPWCRIKFYRLP